MKNTLLSLGLLSLAVPTSASAATILVDYNDLTPGGGHDSEVRKGGFTGIPNQTANAGNLWYNLVNDTYAIPTATTLPSNGSGAENTTLSQFSIPALDLGITLALTGGETFDMGFSWRDASGWGAADTVNLILYYTADNTINGTATNLITLNSGARETLTTWETEAASGISYSDPGAAGKNLFLKVQAIAAIDRFARLDDIHVSVIPEPSTALLGALGALALLRRRR